METFRRRIASIAREDIPHRWAEDTLARIEKLMRFFNRKKPRNAAEGLIYLATELSSPHRAVSAPALAEELLVLYGRCDLSTRHDFLRALPSISAVAAGSVKSAVDAWTLDSNGDALRRLHDATRAGSRHLIELLNLAPDGTRQLLNMRSDLLGIAREPDLKALDADFSSVFTSWFNVGFLELRAINWDSPASILEKIIAYEAVHAIDGWDDLRRRVAPSDRRCYAFFHPRIPDEPLIFIEVALTRRLPSALQEVIAPVRIQLEPASATTAIFYSISNCQNGLRGIPFGNHLIKRVVKLLRDEFPRLAHFATLSPIPGFSDWLNRNGLDKSGADLASLAANYLLTVKSKSGDVADPVARFHLGNGARLEAIHICEGDNPSLASSANVMVNYVYEPKHLEANHLALTQNKEVTASQAVKVLAARHLDQCGDGNLGTIAST